MSGHSKWATIKHKKGAADVRRGKLFAKLIRQVEVAARQGGGDPESNPTLRTMFQKARDASVPLDTIERAVKRGTGELEGVNYEPVTYEGYAPGGVAVLIEVLTDNRNRTSAEIRSVMKKAGGSVAEPGAVAWQFERKGIVFVPATADEDDVMAAALDAGLEDLTAEGDVWRVTCGPSDLPAVRDALVTAGIEVSSADVTMVSSTSVELADPAQAKAVLGVIDALEDHDDVGEVYANFDIPDALLQDLGA
jgi:YebC/PmpR family DNA-binding regulatory protein